jgi:hypothetical protein
MIEQSSHSPNPSTTRRTVVRTAAWTAPAVLALSTAPAFAASGDDLGAYRITGRCGILGIVGTGFLLTAASEPIPAGTFITITGSGVANVGVFSVLGGVANVDVISGTTRICTLQADLPAGATLEMTTTINIGIAFTMDATVTLPPTYTATAAKSTASINSTLVLCSVA